MSRKKLPELDIPDLTSQVTQGDRCYNAFGGFAEVFLGSWTKPESNGIQVPVAIKVLRYYLQERENEKERKRKKIRRELRVWRRLQHENVVPLYGTVSDFGVYPAMVCPWVQKGDLTKYLASCDSELTGVARLRMVSKIAAGMTYLHEQDVIHGDLTGSNILIDEFDRCLLCDFGLSTVIDEFQGTSYLTASIPGSVRWAAPELLEPSAIGSMCISKRSDVFSFGRVIYQVYTGQVPFHHLRADLQVIIEVHRGKSPVRPQDMPNNIWDLVALCWLLRPDDRPEMAACLRTLQDEWRGSDSQASNARSPRLVMPSPLHDAASGYPSMGPKNVQNLSSISFFVSPPSNGHARTPSQSYQPQQPDQLQHPGQQQPPRDMIIPLDRQRFLSAYKGFCDSRNMPFDPTVVIEDGQVDLHQLHIQVMLAGGRLKLASGDAWAVIGGKMGFVQFPGGEGEASKCGPATAQYLMHVYETRLTAFDHMYLSSIAQRQRQAKQQTGLLAGQNGQPQPGAQPHGMGPPRMQHIARLLRKSELQNMGQPGPCGVDSEQQGTNFVSLHQQQPSMSETVGGGGGGGCVDGVRMPPRLPIGMEQAGMHHAIQMLRQFETEFEQRHKLRNWKEYTIPDPQKFQFHSLLNALHRKLSEIETKLPMMAYILKDDMPIRRLVWIVMITTVQRDLLRKNPPKYILDMQGLQNMVQTYGQLINIIQQQWPQIQPPRPPSQPVQPPPQQQPMQPPHSHLQPPQMQHSSSLPPAQPMAPHLSNRPVSLSNPPPGNNPGHKAVVPGSVPSPAAALPVASIPLNTQTPSSQTTPKLPRHASPPKNAPAKAAEKCQEPQVSVSTPSMSAAPARRQAYAEVKSMHPGPSDNLKRLREEETSTEAQLSDGGSRPKKVKSDWEGPLNEEPVKDQDVAEVNSDEDGSALSQKVPIGLSQLAASEEVDEGRTLMDQFGLGDVVGNNSTSPLVAPAVPAEEWKEFFEFFKFSSFITKVGEGDGDSRAPTPELNSSLSTVHACQ